MIKLIITDVDDTIVPEACSVINPEYFDVIRECGKKGILFGVASGRQKPCVKKLFHPVVDEMFILADNGTDIWMKNYQTFMKIQDEDYQQLARELQELGGEYHIMSCKPDIAYIETGHEEYYNHMRSYPYELEYVEDVSLLTDICKVSVWRKDGIEKDVADRMIKRWSDKIDTCLGGDTFLDFTNKGCNKGKALSIIQEHYAIRPEETAVFGNADNDISMLQRAKHSYGVAGASENLKKVASQVIGEMKDDAVLRKIQEILSNPEAFDEKCQLNYK